MHGKCSFFVPTLFTNLCHAIFFVFCVWSFCTSRLDCLQRMHFESDINKIELRVFCSTFPSVVTDEEINFVVEVVFQGGFTLNICNCT